MKFIKYYLFPLFILSFSSLHLFAQTVNTLFPSKPEYRLAFTGSTEAFGGNGRFIPSLLSANRHGVLPLSPNSMLIRGDIAGEMIRNEWRFGAEVGLTGTVTSSVNARLQVCYAKAGYKALEISVGSREYNGVLRNPILSSGGTVWSGNARPIPQVRISLPEFIPVPGTKNWLWVRGDLAYGKFMDDNWLKETYNYEFGFITTDPFFHYKSLFLQTNPAKRLTLTVGIEGAAQFGGKQSFWEHGIRTQEIKNKVGFREFLKVLLPLEGDSGSASGDQNYIYGNHLGAWHGMATYRFENGYRLDGYFEWFFEMGSGMIKKNGWDGLWGIEMEFGTKKIVSGLLLEHLRTTNQSGPIHWAPDDFPNTELTRPATGADNYYNNFFYNGWAHYGMGNGSPLLKGPAFNEDGYLCFTDNRIQAFHGGITGWLIPSLNYQLIASVRKGYGTPYVPSIKTNHNTAAYFRISYYPSFLKEGMLSGAFAADRGNILGNNWSFSISLTKKIHLKTMRR